MQLYCPACKSSAQAAARCPRCGDRLVAPAELSAISRDSLAAPPALREPSAAGRVLFGVVAALGLYVGGRELLAGLEAAVEGDEWGPFAQAADWLVRGVTVAVGGLLAGAGRRNGAALGGVAGLACVTLILALNPLSSQKVSELDIGLSLAIAAAAAAAGRLGEAVWPPPEPVVLSSARSRGSSLVPMKEEFEVAGRAPMSWPRVALGAAVAVVGFLMADPARLALRDHAGRFLNLGTPSQVPVVDALFGTLALLAGGVLAGAATGAGLRQGVAAGLLAGTAVTAMTVFGTDGVVPPMEGLFLAVGKDGEALQQGGGPVKAGVLVAAIVAASGLFGGLLLPKLAPRVRRRRYID